MVSPQAGEPGADQAILDPIHRYHDGTKHHFNRFARSLGYLDWASQPRPFRIYAGAPTFPLYPDPVATAGQYVPRHATFDALFTPDPAPLELTAQAVGDVLRHSLGLSAWKQSGPSRWALRVNPSSGNLHPTEAYVICGALEGLAPGPAVYHYAPDRHALELRCALDGRVWGEAFGARQDVCLIALTSIHWRESWKYGERAFRYCQHDLGHAMAAVSLAASLCGWRTIVRPEWPHGAIAAATGIDRDEDFTDAEREEPGCMLALSSGPQPARAEPALLADGIRNGRWSGRASQLSEDHVQWTFIDDVAAATADPGRSGPPAIPPMPPRYARPDRGIDARLLLRQRRSAVSFDGRSAIDRGAFMRLVASVMPESGAPWLAQWWAPRIHLAIFVHRVDGLAPGLYMLPRAPEAVDRLRAACRPDFLWEPIDEGLPLQCLAKGDVRALAARLSCDQEIASAGFFSLGMLADFDLGLRDCGPSFYRHLFWETGIVGQVLYLESEAAGARATGIGCFYDEPVHEVLGLRGHAFQSLYHFTVGMPIDDARLTTEPGYPWDSGVRAALQPPIPGPGTPGR